MILENNSLQNFHPILKVQNYKNRCKRIINSKIPQYKYKHTIEIN